MRKQEYRNVDKVQAVNLSSRHPFKGPENPE